MRKETFKIVFSSIAIVFAALIAIYAFNYLRFGDSEFFGNKDAALTTNVLWQTPFYLHVAFGGLALLLGGFQFIQPLRDRLTAWHRRMGKIYVISVFISSVSGSVLAIFAEAGPIAKIGFGSLAVLWFVSNWKSYSAICSGDILTHRKWMIRNYCLTFAAVTLRIWLPLELAVFGLNFPDAYRLVAWLCWVPNLLVGEYFVYRLRTYRFDTAI